MPPYSRTWIFLVPNASFSQVSTLLNDDRYEVKGGYVRDLSEFAGIISFKRLVNECEAFVSLHSIFRRRVYLQSFTRGYNHYVAQMERDLEDLVVSTHLWKKKDDIEDVIKFDSFQRI